MPHYSETARLTMLLICFESQFSNLNSQNNTIWKPHNKVYLNAICLSADTMPSECILCNISLEE